MKRPISHSLAYACMFVLLLLTPAPAQAASPQANPAASDPQPATRNAKLTDLVVYPSQVHLSTSGDTQAVIVQATYASGVTRDVTRQATLELVDALARLKGHTLHPRENGKTTLTVTFAGRTLKVPVQVKKADTQRPISFRLDVMPIFMRAGCNTGSCHGAASGQDGFRLSLFGYDPAGDYYRITRQMAGRRINLALPKKSLLIQKALGKVAHTGGQRFTRDSPYYHTLMRWLKAGAPDDPPDVAHVTGVEIFPEHAVLQGEGAAQKFIVRAHYSDGTDRDVTHLAVFRTNNKNAATITKNGLVTAHSRGEAFITARFSTYTVGSPVIVVPPGEFDFKPMPEYNYIDKYVNAKLKKLRINPSGLCSDRVFLRRVYIDLTGTLPTVEEYRAFVSSDDPHKREKLVDKLLKSKEFVELWVMKWSELLMIRSSRNRSGMSYKATILYYNWLKQQFANEVPLDEITRKLIASSGSTFKNPPTNFYEVETDRRKLAENVAQVFMGIRLKCAQCHNHPFDRWTMDDYYSWVAFFSQIGRKEAQDPRATIIFDRGRGQVRHPVTNEIMKPKFLGGKVPEINGRDRREVLAQWIASPRNPYFARNFANRIWAHFFGRGIVEPVDDVRVSNPPVNPQLLHALAEHLEKYGYRFKKLVRDICTSRTYQLTTRPNPTNRLYRGNFSRYTFQRLRAEVLLDAISQVTETEEKFRGLPRGARAVQIPDGRTSNYFLDTFGRCSRKTVAVRSVSRAPTLSQALHLINGPTTNRKIRKGKVVTHLLKAGKTPKQVITNLYIRCFSREPTETEMTKLMEFVHKAEKVKPVLRDVFWALLNSKEFLFNH